MVFYWTIVESQDFHRRRLQRRFKNIFEWRLELSLYVLFLVEFLSRKSKYIGGSITIEKGTHRLSINCDNHWFQNFVWFYIIMILRKIIKIYISLCNNSNTTITTRKKIFTSLDLRWFYQNRLKKLYNGIFVINRTL